MSAVPNRNSFGARKKSSRDGTTPDSLLEAFAIAVAESDRGIIIWAKHPAERLPRIEYINDSALGRVGLTAGAPNADLKQTMKHAQNAALLANLLDRAERGDNTPFEAQMVRMDGTMYWIECICRTLRRENDGTLRFMTLSRDLTKHKQEQDYTHLLATSMQEEPDGVFIVEMSPGMSVLRPRIVYANRAFYEMHGYTKEEVDAGTYPVVLGPKSDRELLEHCVGEVFQGQPVVAEIELYRKDGSSYWAEVRAHGMGHPPNHAVLIIRDVTERRARDEQIGLLSHAIEEASDFVIVTDATPPSAGGPLIVYVNRSFLDATGFASSDLLGQPNAIIYSEANDPKMMAAIRENMERGLPNYREALLRRKDGSTFWTEFVAKPFVSRYEKTPYRLSIGRDITLRKRSSNQVSLLFGAIEAARDRMTLYEPDPDGALDVSYENDTAAQSGRRRLLDLWHRDTQNAIELREALERGEEASQIFAEYEADGTPVVVEYTARAIRNVAGEIEAVLTIERLLTDAKPHDHGFRSRLVNLAVTLPALGQGPTSNERLNILRSILQHTFGVILRENGELDDGRVRIDATSRTASFRYAGKNITGTWTLPLEETSLTALRFVIEAAIEQESLAQASGL